MYPVTFSRRLGVMNDSTRNFSNYLQVFGWYLHRKSCNLEISTKILSHVQSLRKHIFYMSIWIYVPTIRPVRCFPQHIVSDTSSEGHCVGRHFIWRHFLQWYSVPWTVTFWEDDSFPGRLWFWLSVYTIQSRFLLYQKKFYYCSEMLIRLRGKDSQEFMSTCNLDGRKTD